MTQRVLQGKHSQPDGNTRTQRLGKKETFIYNHGAPEEYTNTGCAHTNDLQANACGSASVPYPHHHHRDVVGRAALHRLVGQPVTGSFVAGIYGGPPLPGLDLLILRDEEGLSEQG